MSKYTPEMRDLYTQFCQKYYVPLHFQPWWLDAVCRDIGWNVALAKDKGGEIIGALPYFTSRRWGLKVIQLPPLTTYGGPLIRYPQELDLKEVSRLSFEKKVMTELIRQLPHTVFFKQNFRPEITNWLPFYWEGFQQTTRYTYIFETINDLEQITAGFKNTLRSDLKKAEETTEIRRNDEAWSTVFALSKQSFQSKSIHQPYTLEVFKNLHAALSQRNKSACFVASDRISGRPSAGLYLVFDHRRATILLTRTEPEFKSQCAIYGLFMEAIRFCAERSLSLDFEGSMDEKIEHSFRAFGAQLVPYFQVWKMARVFEVVRRLC